MAEHAPTLTLRPLTAADAATHLAGEDVDIVRWLNDGQTSTLDDVTAWIARAAAAWPATGPTFEMGIDVERVLVGTVTVHTDLDVLADGQVNIAYSVYRQHRGHGYATRAVHAACQFAAGLGARTAMLRIDPANAASAAVAARAGFADTRTVDPDGLTIHTRTLTALP